RIRNGTVAEDFRFGPVPARIEMNRTGRGSARITSPRSARRLLSGRLCACTSARMRSDGRVGAGSRPSSCLQNFGTRHAPASLRAAGCGAEIEVAGDRTRVQGDLLVAGSLRNQAADFLEGLLDGKAGLEDRPGKRLGVGAVDPVAVLRDRSRCGGVGDVGP